MQTSNATFIRTDQIDQQFAITRLRAIETGRWIAVASTNGVTGVIAPDGEVVAAAEPRTQDGARRAGRRSSTRSPRRSGSAPWSGRVAAPGRSRLWRWPARRIVGAGAGAAETPSTAEPTRRAARRELVRRRWRADR